MRHYEIVIMFHPDYSEKVNNMIDEYKNIIFKNNGKIHRLEDWGRKQLSYTINNLHKAHYLLMNIEVNPLLIKELENNFRFNDKILRNLIMVVKKPISIPSIMMKIKENKKEKLEELNKKTISSSI